MYVWQPYDRCQDISRLSLNKACGINNFHFSAEAEKSGCEKVHLRI